MNDLPIERPAVTSWSLTPEVQIFATGFQAALARKPKVIVQKAKLEFDRPRRVTIPIGKPKIKTFSLAFSGGAAAPAFLQSKTKPEKSTALATTEPAPPSEEKKPPKKYTRLKPPGDLVKLEDRLFYVLQPPLEVWAAGAQVEFPFRPFPYQFEGIAFLYPRYAALLADEMGLGKTMQTISTMRLLLRAGEVRNVLLICPKPLVNNWQREFTAWAPEIPILAIEGDQAKRRWQWSVCDVAVKIANYELLQRDRELLEDPQMRFDLVVLDEAQRIKNIDNTTSQIVRRLHRRRSWALTGTPIENRPDDLVGIFEYLAPGYLSTSMKPHRLGELASEYVLRRTKDKVLTDMPPKMIRDEFIELSPAQLDSYRLAEDKGVLRLSSMGEELTIQHVFELVLRLKQICNFDPLTGDSSKVDRIVAELEEVAASGQKALIFSQWVDSLEELAKRLAHLNPLEYHGRVPHHQRAGIIDRFKAEKKHSVILMSYGAGGVGLNLQFATYVFLFDRWWNPAIEDQAINRAHRIGAAGPVTVTRFIAADTVEERIDRVLSEKRELFASIFSDDAPQRNLGLNKGEIFGLFKLRCPQGPIDVEAA